MGELYSIQIRSHKAIKFMDEHVSGEQGIIGEFLFHIS